jgi:hypothetical protein
VSVIRYIINLNNMYTKNYEILNFISIGVKRGGSIVEFRPLILSTLYEYGNIFEFIFYFLFMHLS